jgi:hypothetical protein
MDWTTPDFVEIKMDAEIGSYQESDEVITSGAPPVLEVEPASSAA